WNSIPGGSIWQWDDVHNSDQGGDFVTYDLTEGSHTLIICHREDGAALDKLYLTRTEATPSGLGDDAGTCEPGVNIESGHAEQKVFLYPNPVRENLVIELEGISSHGNVLYLYNSLGMQVKALHLENEKNVLDVSGLPDGLYFFKPTVGNNEVHVEKFIKM
ncbi:MAG: T9SS type A sorting domain-containing protein, partial [Bacteroidales bacterium]|nr:T9SS type A sorting domain-containing protein [Bacteroidales bacterium]